MEPGPTELPREIESLTQKTNSGDQYQRNPKVEDQIKWALTLSQDTLTHLLNETQPDDRAYLKEETLVYLIRTYYKLHQREMIEVLWEALYKRCTKMIRSKIPRYDERSEQAEQEVQAKLFEQIVHPEGQQGDFLQIRFWSGFRALVITISRTLIIDLQKGQLLDPLSSLPGQELEQAEEEPEEQDQLIAKTIFGLSREIPTEIQVEINEVLKRLPALVRKAFILHYYLGFPIEPGNPDETTVGMLLGKSPRTIFNWLSEAEKILIQWRGEIHE